MTVEKPPALTANALVRSFERHLKAENKRAATIDHYVGAAKQFIEFARAEHLPAIEHVTREHVEMWLERLHETYKPHSVRNRFVGLRIFFRWLALEGEIEHDPTIRIKPPQTDQVSKDVATPDEIMGTLDRLEKKARDKKASKVERARAERDALIIALLYDTGMRAGELADLRTEYVAQDTGLIFIATSKNRKSRVVRLSPVGLRFLDRYLRHLDAEPEYLLAGKRGKMTRSGIYQVVTERFAETGVKATIGPHDLRHSSASHVALAGNMSESEAMTLYGWSDAEMWRLYTAQARQQAALDAHGRASPLSRLMEQKK